MLSGKKMLLAGSLVVSLVAAQQANAVDYTYAAPGATVLGDQATASGLTEFLDDDNYADQDVANTAAAWANNPGTGAIWDFDPTITLDLGSTMSLDSLVINYQLWGPAAVVDWASVDITIDGGTPINFAGFPSVSDPTVVDEGVTFNVERNVVVDLSGNSGQIIQLDFTRGSFPTANAFGALSEIDVVIPEPASMALLGLGGLMVLRRRR